MSSDCLACMEADRTPHWGMFVAGCPGCKARAVSRGINFHESCKAGKQTARYRMELDQFGVTHQQVLDAYAADASNRADAAA